MKLDAETLRSGIGLNTRIINDFHGQMMFIGSLRETKTLGGNDQSLLELASRKVVLGPGTGLGSAFVNGVVGEAVGYDVIESEAGHADFAPGNHLELELGVGWREIPVTSAGKTYLVDREFCACIPR